MPRRQCEFQLIRYVPDPVKNEFVNIGVVLRASGGGQTELRLTRDWARVRCLDPDADIEMLEALEIEISSRLRNQAAERSAACSGPILEDTLSNGFTNHPEQGLPGGELRGRGGRADAALRR